MKNFKTLKAFETFVRKSKTPDTIRVNGIIYTMMEYDSSGREISYGNKRTGKTLLMNTSNRYGAKGFKDAEVVEGAEGYLRNDISYVD